MSNVVIWLSRVWNHSVRRQLILGVAAAHAVLLGLVIVDLVGQQRHLLHNESVLRAEGLAGSLAASSLSWTLSNDLMGLAETTNAMQSLRGVNYACILDPSGRVLAHTQSGLVGRYASDAISLRLLEPPMEPKRLLVGEGQIDVAAPILAGGRLLGWARIGLNQQREQEAISRLVGNGVSYALVAIIVGALLGFVIARRLSAGLEKLVGAVDAVRSGARDVQADETAEDEIGRLGAGFNAMLRAVREGEEKFRTVADFTNNWEYWRAPDGGLVWMAPSCLQSTGYTAEEFLADPELLRRIIHPDDMQIHDRHIHEVESGSTAPGELELRVIHKSGRVHWFEHFCQDITRADGALLGRRVCNRDVTSRKQAEEGLRRWARVFENAAWGIVVCSPYSRLLEAMNPAFAHMHGYAVAELSGQPLALVYPEETLHWVEAELRRSHETGHHVFEADHVRKDGSRFPAQMDVTAVKDERGEVLYRVVNVQDITERRRTRDELIKAKEAAEAANAAKSDFLAVMSHELRTPLNGIKGMLYVLRDAELSVEERKEYFEHALGSVDNLAVVLNDVLDITRIEAGRMDIVDEPFTVQELTQPVCSNLAAAAQAKGVELVCSIDPRLPERFTGAAGRIRQILLNLMGNAVKFTSGGSVRMQVYPLPVNAAAAKAGCLPVHFVVEDNGIGMEHSQLKRIFEPFTQLESPYTRSHGGAGLGLSIVMRLTTLLGGRIEVYSEPGQGSEFHLTLPLRVSGHSREPGLFPDQRLDEAVGAELAAGLSGAPLRRSILVVEDDPLNMHSALKLLEVLGYEAHPASSGAQALQTLAAMHFDAVLMDVQMPEMDGMMTTQRIRASDGEFFNPGIPVVAVTAHAMHGDRDRFLAAGMDEYLSKPYSLEELQETLWRVLGRP